MELSKSQEEAISTINGQVILISCPGSGKTSTVVRRVKYMVDHGIPGEQILVLTFSKAAAVEMQERYAKLSNTILQGTVFATIHSFCYNVIAPIYRLSFENILTEAEAWMIIRRGIDELRKNHKLKMEIRDFSDFTSSCIREISVVNNNGVNWDSYSANTCPTEEFHQIYNLYETRKRNMGKIDYDDMLKFCYDVFLNQPDVLAYYKQKFRYIIVDEYQDTNYLQRDILYMLAGSPDEANLCVVGDDDQSIYKFRGARPEIMLNFAKQYPGCKQIYMDMNYRSEPEIIESARRLINFNKSRFAKDIKPFHTGKGIVEIVKTKDSKEEIYKLLDKINVIHKQYAYEEMAVLYRNNKQASYLSLVLLGNKIPFHCGDRLQSPYQHWIFSDFSAFYKLSSGTGTNQNLIQVINKPNRFIPTNPLRKVELNKSSIKTAVRRELNEYWKVEKAIDHINTFFMHLDLLKDVTPDVFLNGVCGFLGYREYLKNYAKYRNQDPSELLEIINGYKNDIKDQNIQTMDEWFAYAKLMNQKIENMNQEKNKKGICLSTMHKSKGLEWPAVLIIGANEGIIPSQKTSEDIASLEEERRLFYVATTRAKQYLCISSVENNETETRASRFVAEFNGSVCRSQKPVSKSYAVTLRKGMRVNHRQYGSGVIMNVSSDAALVKFASLSEYTVVKKEHFNELTPTK